MSPQLHAAVENVYNAFKDVAKPRFVNGCPCCIDAKGVNILLAKPLRELSPNDLTHYASSVFLTVGSVADFFYFLSRMLEIHAAELSWWPDPEVVATAILTSEFYSWPVTWREALSRYFEAIIDELLEKDNFGWELDSWICALGRLHINLKPYLGKITAKKSRLIDFYEVNSAELVDGKLMNSFWDDAPNEHKLVVEWFQSTEIKKIIEHAYGIA